MKYFFSSGPLYQQTGIAIIRIVVGLFLVYHGWEVFDAEKMKGYAQWDQFNNQPATIMVYAGKLAEFIGGIFLTFGFMTRVASLLIAGTMLYISFFVGNGKIWYEDQHPFLFVLLAMVFFFTGPGKWSVDGKIFRY
jgi:uncharacterized membrane protein YphA (DoxX/SURF4 family)